MYQLMPRRSLWPFGFDVYNEWARSVFVKVPDSGTFWPYPQKDS